MAEGPTPSKRGATVGAARIARQSVHIINTNDPDGAEFATVYHVNRTVKCLDISHLPSLLPLLPHPWFNRKLICVTKRACYI